MDPYIEELNQLRDWKRSQNREWEHYISGLVEIVQRSGKIDTIHCDVREMMDPYIEKYYTEAETQIGEKKSCS